MNTHVLLTYSSLSPHDRKGREEEGKRKGRDESAVAYHLTVGATIRPGFPDAGCTGYAGSPS